MMKKNKPNSLISTICPFFVSLCISFWMLSCLLFSAPDAFGADTVTASLKMEDFAYGIPLKPMAKGAVCRLDVPLEIYSASTRPDLKDIRIFNQRGETVPYIIRRKQKKKSDEKIITPLTFFPVHMDKGNTGGPLSMQITTDKAGSIISVRSGVPGEVKKPANAYIIDASALDAGDVRKLEVGWISSASSFYVEASVFASHDLNRWNRLVPSAPLVRLVHGGHELTRHTISLPVNTYRYFRLEWPQAPKGARITEVNAIQTGRLPEAVRLHREVSGRRISDGKEMFEFDTGGFFPVDYVQVLLAEPNSLIQGMLESRPDKTSNWQQRCTATFYDLRMGETPLLNEPAGVAPNYDRYWRLTVRNQDGGLGQEPPRLEIQWNPNEMLFLARGGDEYTLAIGNARPDLVRPSQSPFIQILKQADKAGTPFAGVKTGVRFNLAGPSALEPPKPPFPWKRAVLWFVLAAGVGLVGWMAWQLVQQMKAGEGD